MLNGRSLFLAALLLSLTPRPVFAQTSTIPAAPSNPSPADVAKAKTLFTSAGKLFEKADYAAAIQTFERSYALSGRASVLFSLGQAYRKRYAETQDPRHKAAALECYTAYLKEVPKGGRSSDAEAARRDLSSTDPAAPNPTPTVVERKTLLSIDSTTPGALISIDGGEPAPPQVDAEVEPGRHTVKVTAPGFVEQEFVIQALVGQTEAETYVLEEAPVELSLNIPSGATVHIDGQDRGESSFLKLAPGRRFISVSSQGHQSFGQLIEVEGGTKKAIDIDLPTTIQRDASIGLMIGGAATMVGGGALLTIAFLAQSDAQALIEKRETTGISPDENAAFDELIARRDDFRALGLSVGVVGGAAFLAGGAMFLFDNTGPLPLPIDDSRKKPTAAPAIDSLTVVPIFTPDEGGLLLSGRF